MRWSSMLSVVVVACGPNVEGSASEDGTSAQVGSESAASGGSSSSGSISSTGDDESASSSTTPVTTVDVKMDVFEPDPIELECSREGALEGQVEIETPIGGLEIASAFWGWNWCCGPYPVVVLSEEDVLRVEDWQLPGPPSEQAVFMAMVFTEGQAPWSGEFPSRFVAGRGDEYESIESGVTTIVGALVEPELESGPLSIELGFVDDGNGWRVEGQIVAEYCGALDYPGCPCE